MPLYCYECSKCDIVIEKFQHNSDNVEVQCIKCENVCNRIMGISHNRVKFNARENLNRRLQPEVNRIMNKISKGSDKDFIDIAGESK